MNSSKNAKTILAQTLKILNIHSAHSHREKKASLPKVSNGRGAMERLSTTALDLRLTTLSSASTDITSTSDRRRRPVVTTPGSGLQFFSPTSRGSGKDLKKNLVIFRDCRLRLFVHMHGQGVGNLTVYQRNDIGDLTQIGEKIEGSAPHFDINKWMKKTVRKQSPHSSMAFLSLSWRALLQKFISSSRPRWAFQAWETSPLMMSVSLQSAGTSQSYSTLGKHHACITGSWTPPQLNHRPLLIQPNIHLILAAILIRVFVAL